MSSGRPAGGFPYLDALAIKGPLTGRAQLLSRSRRPDLVESRQFRIVDSLGIALMLTSTTEYRAFKRECGKMLVLSWNLSLMSRSSGVCNVPWTTS
jgi:hypothetical protein